MTKRLYFMRRWAKLEQPVFTTARKASDWGWRVGDRVIVTLGSWRKLATQNTDLAFGYVVQIAEIRLGQLTEEFARQDAEMGIQALRTFFRKLYHLDGDWYKFSMKILLIEVRNRGTERQRPVLLEEERGLIKILEDIIPTPGSGRKLDAFFRTKYANR